MRHFVDRDYQRLVVADQRDRETLALDFDAQCGNIRRGFHINAHVVGPGVPLIATTLTVQEIAEASVEYPPGEELRVAFTDKLIRVYSDDVTLVVRFPMAPKVSLRLSLFYQACDAAACLPPVTKQIEVARGTGF